MSVEPITRAGARYPWSHTNIHGLVVARFHYALSAIAGQILVNDLQRIDAIFLQKHPGGSLLP